jgi:ABC-type dipeptide/oligopeptide/nickel transport systems, permease components
MTNPSSAQLDSSRPVPHSPEREVARVGMLRLTLRRLLRSPSGQIGLVCFAIVFCAGLFAPILAPYDPIEQFIGSELQPPSGQYWLGTDELGRDLLSRILYGARLALLVGVVAVGAGSLIGVSLGMLAGYLGGWFESVTMRLWDTLLAFPGVLIAIAISAMLGPGVFNVGLAVAIISLPGYARLARAGVLAEREKEYVLAARSLGVPVPTIIFRHILPNILPPILTQVALGMASAVFLEAGLSFLGLGAQPPEPSWGGMLADSRTYMRQAAWYGIAPGLAITLFLMGLNFLADGLRDALDPTRRI